MAINYNTHGWASASSMTTTMVGTATTTYSPYNLSYTTYDPSQALIEEQKEKIKTLEKALEIAVEGISCGLCTNDLQGVDIAPEYCGKTPDSCIKCWKDLYIRQAKEKRL